MRTCVLGKFILRRTLDHDIHKTLSHKVSCLTLSVHLTILDLAVYIVYV